MSKFELDQRNKLKQQLAARLVFNKKETLNAINDLDMIPRQKAFLVEQLTNVKIFPETSMIQEIQKKQAIEDSSKPLIKALKMLIKNKY